MRELASPCVLCAVDDSAAAARAALVAAELADSLELRLVLAHVPTDPAPASADEPEAGELMRIPAPTAQSPVARVLTPWGDPVTGICDALERENAVMLVVGSRSRGAVASALMGSVSRSLVARATVPVTVVPAELAGPLRAAAVA